MQATPAEVMGEQAESRSPADEPLFPAWSRIRPGSLWRAALGSVLGFIALGLMARGVDLRQVWGDVSRVDPFLGGLALLTVLLTTGAKVCRWRDLFPETRSPGLPELGRALLIGQLTNAIVPARAGELVRAHLIGVDGGVDRLTALGTIVAEKAFDVLFLLISGGVAILLVPSPPWLDLPVVALTVGCVTLLALALWWPERRVLSCAERWAGRLPRRAGEWVVGALRRGAAGLEALREPKRTLTACGWSAAIWALATGTNYLLFLAFDLPLSVGAALMLLVLLHIGVAPPSSPGRLGVFHALTLLGLETLGVDRSRGLAYAAVLHLIVYAPQIVPGAVLLDRRRRGAQAGGG